MPLLDATRTANKAQVEKTLKTGANPDIRNAQGITPLMIASYKGYATLARILLSFGANPNLASISNIEFNFGKLLSSKSSKATALMLAALSGNLEIVVALLKAHANPNAQDSDGQTALMYAILADPHWPHKPLDATRKKIILALLEAGADAQLTDNNGLSASYYYSCVAGLIPGFAGDYDNDPETGAKDPLYRKMQ